MFKLTAFFFLMVNGVAADKPADVLSYNKATFPTEEACLDFAKSDEGKKVLQVIEIIVEGNKGRISAKIGCVKSEAEDNKI